MANVDIKLGYKDSAWFTANATLVLKVGQIVYLEQTGTYKIGDGITQLSSLTFLGGGGTVDVNTIGAAINGATSATPNDTDLVMSVESSVAKKNTWTQIKAFLKTYFDGVYTTTSAVASQITSALSSYVPYTNATQDTDLGNYSLNAKSLHVKGTGGNGHLGLKHQSSNITANASESSLGADSSGNPVWKNDGNAIESIELQTNKTSTITGNETSTVKYPTIKGMYDWATGLFATISSLSGYVKKGIITNNTILKGSSTDTATNSQITDDGNTVNIGTTVNTGVGEILRIGGHTVFNNTTQNYVDLHYNPNSGYGGYERHYSDRAEYYYDRLMINKENGTSQVDINAYGNNEANFKYKVSIGGTFDPQEDLHVNGNIRNNALTASKIVQTDASKNLTSSSYSVSDLLVKSNNLSDVSNSQTAKANLNIDKRTTVGDTNYTILTTDKEVVTSTTLTNNRTYTLPTGETAGQEFIVADEFQALGTYTITVGVATGKKLNGVLNGTVTMVTTGGHRRFFGDGSGNYTFDAGIARLGVSQTFSGTNTFSTAPVLSSLTASQLLATDGSKNVQTLTTATYPSLTELAYVKGVTSAIQTQIDGKLTASNNLSDLSNFITARNTNLRVFDMFLTNNDQTTTSNSASNITDLVSPTLTANKRYKISGIIHVGCNNTGGVKIQITIPTGATIFVNGWTIGNAATTGSVLSPIVASATLTSAFNTYNGSVGHIMIQGEIALSSTAGTIQFGFASGTNTQTSTIYQLGTQLTVTQIN